MHDIENLEQEVQETVEAMSADAREAWEELERLFEQARTSEDMPLYSNLAMTIIESMYPSARKELSKAVGLHGQRGARDPGDDRPLSG